MDKITDLTKISFIGTVLPDLDPNNQGRYKVHIPLLMPHIPETKGIFVKNHLSGTAHSQMGEYTPQSGAMPLQPGTQVAVRFQFNDFNTGYIERAITDSKLNSQCQGQDQNNPISRPEDRDRITILSRTSNRGNMTYINEETKEEPNTYYRIFNRDGNPQRRTVERINEDGITYYTRDNNRRRIGLDDNEQIDKNQTTYIKGIRKINIDQDDDLTVNQSKFTTINANREDYIKGKDKIQILGNYHMSCDNEVNTFSYTTINFDSKFGSINCGVAYYDEVEGTRPKTEVKDLGPSESKEYDTALGDGCDGEEGVSQSFNVGPYTTETTYGDYSKEITNQEA